MIKHVLIFILLILSVDIAQADNPPTGIQDEGGALSYPAFNLNCVGAGIACTHSGSTATLTVAGGGHGDGANCSAGSYPLGVDANGAVQSCTDVTTEIDAAIATHTAIADAHHTPTVDTNANTICSGTTTYLDGEGNCDTITTFPGFTSLDADYGNETITSDFDFGGGVFQIPNSITLPGTCEVGDTYMDTDQTTGQRFYLCESANTWVKQGDGTGGTPAFTDITTGTNTTATMTVGTGATLTTSGSGTIVATTAAALAANGANCSAGSYAIGVDAAGAAEGCAVDSNAATLCAGTTTYLDGEGNCDTITTFPGFTSLDADYGNETVTSDIDVGGGVFQIPNSATLPGTCEVGDTYMDTDATTGQRFYLCESANTWAKQGDGTGGTPSFTDLTTGTNTTATMTVGTGGALTTSGSGTIAATTAAALAANGGNCSAGSAPLGVDAAGAVESCTDYEEDLSNSAGLAAALSDETGTGVAVFGTSPTFTTSVNLPAGAIDAATEITADIITHAQIADADQADTKCFTFYESDGIDAADDLFSIWANKTANDFLITEIWCETDVGTVTAMLQVDDGTPADVDNTDIACDTTEEEDVALDGDTTVSAGEELDWAVTSTATVPLFVRVCFTGNWVD